jgi:DNA-binding transcriptional LysR family regulator
MTKAGVGIGINPVGVEEREGNLVRLDFDFSPSFTFWLVCHRDAKDIPRNRALIDHLKGVSKELDQKV